MKTAYKLNFALMIVSLFTIFSYIVYSNITGYTNVHIVSVCMCGILLTIANYVLILPILSEGKKI